MSTYLSKSDFMKYQECPSYFWLWKNNRGLVEEIVSAGESANYQQYLLDQGNLIDKKAQELFPTGVVVDLTNDEGYRDPELAQRRTNELVETGTKVILQATAIADDQLLAIADVIARDGDSWILYEVKGTSEVKKEHYADLAFQKFVFESAGYQISDTKVIHINKSFVFDGHDIDANYLLTTTDVTDELPIKAPDIRAEVADALSRINAEEPTTCGCRFKTKSNHCPTFAHFNPDIPEYSLYDVPRISEKKVQALLDKDVIAVSDIPTDFDLTDTQNLHVDVARAGQATTDLSGIMNELDKLEYPIYFLDYETLSTGIPITEGVSPFDQMVFQYSLHVLEAPDGDLKHFEGLMRTASRDELEKLVKQLAQELGQSGSVVVWNASFETGRNKDLGTYFPEYSDFFDSVNGRIYDLMEPFSKGHYVDPEFRGSFSIKNVLPALFPDDPELDYTKLGIGKGDLALMSWHQAVTDMSPDEADKVFNDLIAYCRLDTLAMVKIYELLRELS